MTSGGKRTYSFNGYNNLHNGLADHVDNLDCTPVKGNDLESAGDDSSDTCSSDSDSEHDALMGHSHGHGHGHGHDGCEGE